MKKIVYLANARIPTEKAHGLAIMKMCEALADQGVEVVLVVPQRKNLITANPFDFYQVRPNFKIKKLWSWDLVAWGKFGFWIQMNSFCFRAWLYLFWEKGSIYTREEYLAFWLKLFGKEVVWETHMGRHNFFVMTLIKLKVPIVAISNGLRELYLKHGAGASQIITAHDGVDLQKFTSDLPKLEARKKMNLPLEKKIVMYTGHLYAWKGVETLAKAASWLGEEIMVVFVGGTDNDILSFQSKYSEQKNILIMGRRPYGDMPVLLKAADVLVLPNSGQENISKFYTSPLKLFEYMASDRPIVASDLPSIHEVLDASMAYFFEPDNPKSLACVISQALSCQEVVDQKAIRALLKVEGLTWAKRAQSVLRQAWFNLVD